jgi:hypothetical protein
MYEFLRSPEVAQLFDYAITYNALALAASYNVFSSNASINAMTHIPLVIPVKCRKLTRIYVLFKRSLSRIKLVG